jgi:hypothetical protein
MELVFLTDSHFTLNCVDDIQELFYIYISHPKPTFDCDEDTASLVEEPTLTMMEILPFDCSDFADGNTTIASKDYCYEIEADVSQFNYHGPKIMISK